MKTLTRETITLDGQGFDSIDIVKAKIQDKKGIPANQQELKFVGMKVQDGKILVDDEYDACSLGSKVHRQTH